MTDSVAAQGRQRVPGVVWVLLVAAGAFAVLVAAAAAVFLLADGRSGPKRLEEAVRSGDVAAVKACLADGVPADARYERPWPVGGLSEPVLVGAAGSKDLRMVEALVAAGADVNHKTPGFHGVLGRAAGQGSTEILEFLLRHGADPNLGAPRPEWTPLHAATLADRPDAVRILLDHGADPRRAAPTGGRPIHMALDGRFLAAARELARSEAEPDVFVAAALGPAERLAALVERHPSWLVASPEPLPETPLLHLAARCGHREGVLVLLDAGFEIDAAGPKRSTWGSTALHQAAREGETEIVRLLLDRGAKIDANVGHGTPLHYAAARGQVETMKLLLDRGAAVDARRGAPGSETPLYTAALTGHADALELLLARGADRKAKILAGNGGETALDVARRRGDAAVVRALDRPR